MTYDAVTGTMAFEDALVSLKKGGNVRMRRWAPDVYLTIQGWDANSKMTAPYIYVTSRFGRVPWVATQSEMLSSDWEEAVVPL